MQYDWEGSVILRETVSSSKRRVIGNEDVLIPTDLREWVSSLDSQVVKNVVKSLRPPPGKGGGTFDKRARLVWKYVLENTEYCSDEDSQRKLDFWQFPAETLALKKGDCEDCTFLVTSLLLASGISPFCVRAVVGELTQNEGPPVGHSWPIYKDEHGSWRVLETTLKNRSAKWPPPLADDLAKPESDPCYRPVYCLNQYHVWKVGPR